MNCWSEDCLSRIGNVIGVPLYNEEYTSKGLRVLYARLLIKMDVTLNIPKEVVVEESNGTIFKQIVLFDWLPPLC